MRVSRRDDRPLLAAGLWALNDDRFCCTMIPRPPIPELQDVHDRMPALLLSRDLTAWLHGAVPEVRKLLAHGWPAGVLQVTATN